MEREMHNIDGEDESIISTSFGGGTPHVHKIENVHKFRCSQNGKCSRFTKNTLVKGVVQIVKKCSHFLGVCEHFRNVNILPVSHMNSITKEFYTEEEEEKRKKRYSYVTRCSRNILKM